MGTKTLDMTSDSTGLGNTNSGHTNSFSAVGQLLKGLGVISLTVFLTGIPISAAMAQSTIRVIEEDGDVVELPTLLDEFEDTYFTLDRNYYQNHRFPQSLRFIFGAVERDISGDGRRVNALYREALEQQITSTDIIRVADLPNPFTTTLGTSPLYIEEPLPPAPIPSYIPSREPAPRARPGAPEDSVPALW